MTKELGISPRSLIKNIPSPAQPWKAPVKDWIHELYGKQQQKTAQKTSRRQGDLDRHQQQAVEMESGTAIGHGRPGDADNFDDFQVEVTGIGIAEANQDMLRRQGEFRKAGELVGQALAELLHVQKVVLFGSVAVPLRKEIPRFREFRDAGLAIWHECKDVDLAVWVTNLEDLKSLQRARSRALTALLENQQIGVAQYQVDVFLMEPGSDRYLGRLCRFGQCPKGKLECLVPGCGREQFLQQHQDFVLTPDAFEPDKSVLLFARQSET